MAYILWPENHLHRTLVAINCYINTYLRCTIRSRYCDLFAELVWILIISTRVTRVLISTVPYLYGQWLIVQRHVRYRYLISKMTFFSIDTMFFFVSMCSFFQICKYEVPVYFHHCLSSHSFRYRYCNSSNILLP